jgi:hypothetical protein
MKRTTLAACIIAALIIAVLTVAASASEIPAAMAGKWCHDENHAGELTWMYFKRGNRCRDSILLLKKNGDYTLIEPGHRFGGITSAGHRLVCKAKSYSDGGWKYACTLNGGLDYYDITEKWTIDGRTLVRATAE